MEPIERNIDAFVVTGIRVRTKNQNEANPTTAKIGPLWGTFFNEEISEQIANKDVDGAMYGVYSNYESDASGLFDVTIGCKTVETNAYEWLVDIRIQWGKYLAFENSGPLPQAVIDTWMQIWQFFPTHPEYKRSYLTDFEHYTSPEEVTVYIGIE